MDIKIMARGVAYIAVALAGGLLGAAIALNDRQYPTAEAARTEPSPATAALDAELAHCQAIGPEAANGGACKAIWEANRRRSFESGKLYRDRVTDAVPATPDLKEPASPLARELPTSAPQSPSTPNSNAPQPPGDIAGHPK
jgi:conjugative transfer region protein TrbK